MNSFNLVNNRVKHASKSDQNNSMTFFNSIAQNHNHNTNGNNHEQTAHKQNGNNTTMGSDYSNLKNFIITHQDEDPNDQDETLANNNNSNNNNHFEIIPNGQILNGIIFNIFYNRKINEIIYY